MRRLPPLNSLRAFEAAVRHGSFTLAARELSVTQGAVSRQVALLEERVRAPLFRRVGKRVEPTLAAQAFASVVGECFDRIERASGRLVDQTEPNRLRVRIFPTVAARWLIPRLATFHARVPDTELVLTTTVMANDVDFDRDDVDVAFRYLEASQAGLSCDLLFGEVLLPVCSPALLAGGRRRVEPDALAAFVSLHSNNRGDDWPRWLEAAGAQRRSRRALRFGTSELAYRAAIDGLGVAMAQLDLVADDLATGRLIAPCRLRLRTGRGYYLVTHAERLARPVVAAFRDWILAQTTAQARSIRVRAPVPTMRRR